MKALAVLSRPARMHVVGCPAKAKTVTASGVNRPSSRAARVPDRQLPVLLDEAVDRYRASQRLPRLGGPALKVRSPRTEPAWIHWLRHGARRHHTAGHLNITVKNAKRLAHMPSF